MVLNNKSVFLTEGTGDDSFEVGCHLIFRKKLSNHSLVISNLQDNFGVGIAAVEAAKKKHEAIQTDIKAYESRVKTVVDMANTLENELYWGIDRIKEDLDKVHSIIYH